MKNTIRALASALFRSSVLIAVALFLWLQRAEAQPSETPLTQYWRTDGPVYSLLVTNGTTYLGGSFTYVGPNSGSAGVLDLTTGEGVQGFPTVVGAVYASAPDGNGGWFIGGAFTNVGSVIRTNLAHILADNSVDPAWVPNANGVCLEIAVSGSNVYVGGAFTRVGGQTRNRIAALDATTGQSIAWNPNAGGTVYTIVPSGNLVYAGGSFTTIGGQSRLRIAALDAGTGTATSWDPSAANGTVTTIAVDGSTVYAGGTFTTINAKPRNRIAALGASDGVASNWDPVIAGGSVSNIVVTGNAVYFSGAFATVGGLPRVNAAAVDKVNPQPPLAWDPSASTNVNTLVLVGDAIYSAGAFNNIGGVRRGYVAALDLTNGAALPWSGAISGLVPGFVPYVQTLSVSGNKLFVGGSFASIGGFLRNNLAAIDNASGQANGWNPNPDGLVYALAGGGNTVYVGGTFTNIGGAARNRLAALHSGTGVATAWNPDVRGRTGVGVLTLLPSTSQLLVGGINITSVGGVSRTNLFSVGLLDGLLSPLALPTFRSATAGSVNSLLQIGNTLYVGGDFGSVGGQSRTNLAAVDFLGSGSVQSWNPIANSSATLTPVASLVAAGNLLYAGGNFTNLGGIIRNRMGAVDLTTAAVAPWNPNVSAGSTPHVNVLTLGKSGLFVGGQFQIIGGDFRTNVATINLANGQAYGWSPSPNGQVRAIVAAGNEIFLGGDFTAIGDSARAYFAVFSTVPSILSHTIAITNGQYSFRIETGDNAQVVVARSSDLVTWTPVVTNAGGANVQFTDPLPISGQTEQFYRVYSTP